MARGPAQEELIRKHIWMFRKDWDQLEALYQTQLGTSTAIRFIIRNFLKHIENKVEANARPNPTPDLTSVLPPGPANTEPSSDA